MVLIQRLSALRMLEGQDMVEHLDRFREGANQVQSISSGSKRLKQTTLVTLLSLGLPELYEPIIMALQSRTDNPTFDMFTGRLLQEAARRQVVKV